MQASERVYTGKRCLLAKWLNGSSFQVSEPACPDPITSQVSREREKSQNICFEKDIKLIGSAVYVPLPCTFRQLYVGSWHLFPKILDIVVGSMPPDMVDHLHLQNRIKK